MELYLEILKLEWVSRILQAKNVSLKQKDLIYRNRGVSPVTLFKASDAVETLKSILESLVQHLKESNLTSLSPEKIFPQISQNRVRIICNCSDSWMHNRQSLEMRLQESKRKLDDLYNIYWAYILEISAAGDVSSDNRLFTFEKIHQFIDVDNPTFIAAVTGLYRSYQWWQDLDGRIRGNFFHANLRLPDAVI